MNSLFHSLWVFYLAGKYRKFGSWAVSCAHVSRVSCVMCCALTLGYKISRTITVQACCVVAITHCTSYGIQICWFIWSCLLSCSPKEFLESVDHVRFLCWLYIGALTHHAVAENVLRVKCQPLPLDDVNNVCVIVMSIMTGFVEYNASSVEFMSSLFYGFILCQVRTLSTNTPVYLMSSVLCT